MSVAPASAEPPAIPGVRRSHVQARGVRFHVTESGPADARPVLALHGWPQHHWVYRDLLASPPDGLRIIAPDLPGYGWSGPPRHRWEKQEVALDVLALATVLGLDRFLLVGHDWGGWIGHLIALEAPERVDGYLALNIPHPWQTPRTMAPHLWRFMTYQPFVASAGVLLQRRTSYLQRLYRVAAAGLDRDVVRTYSERFRDPVVARAGRDTYRTFLLRELPAQTRHPERRRGTVPTRALFGIHDSAIHPSLAEAATANADDYAFEPAEAGHFIVDEQPELVRARLITLAGEVPAR